MKSNRMFGILCILLEKEKLRHRNWRIVLKPLCVPSIGIYWICPVQDFQ